MRSLENCDFYGTVKVVISGTTYSNDHKNELARINKKLASQGMSIDKGDQACFSDSLAVLLIDSKMNLRGAYSLEQGEINRFFAELDIVLLIENYGKGVSR